MKNKRLNVRRAVPANRRGITRRSALNVVGGTIAGIGIATTSATAASEPEPEIRFEDQESDGTTITVAYATTNVDAYVAIGEDGYGDTIGDPENRLNFEAGEMLEDIDLRPDHPPLEERTYQLTAVLFNSDGSRKLDEDEATLEVTDPPSPRNVAEETSENSSEESSELGTQLVDANPDAGFNYPYYLHVPNTTSPDARKPILVEPNNTGSSTDNFDEHLADAERRVSGGTGRRMADELDAPFLMPVLPRPREEPVDGDHYVHQLDDTTMEIAEGPLERIDLQVRNMIEHAQEELTERSYPVTDEIMMNGYSASGNFVNRFTVLQPDIVKSVTAGGINGMLTLPISEDKGHMLDYHIGVANLEELTGEPFDLESFRSVHQFIHMGEIDTNDTIPFSDSWTDDEMRQTALEVYGDHMQEERLPYSKSVYDDVGASSVFRIYEGEGHTPRPAEEDMAEFHRRSLAGDDIDDIRVDLGGNVPDPRARFSHTPEEPLVDEQVAFDASRSEVWDRELINFKWDFGNGETATGERTTHRFESHGGHNVILTVTDDTGQTYEASTQVRVDRDPDNVFRLLGVGGAVAGLGSVAYVLKQRLTGTDKAN